MGLSKDNFIAQREFELMQMNSRDLKREAIAQAKSMLEDNEAEQIYSKSVRLEKYLSEFNTAIKPHLEHLETFNGVEFQEGNRTTYNYKEDSLYRELEKQLSDRKKLLEMRAKLSKVIFDDEGVEVTLVSSSTTTFIKALIK
jgi:hypothetical protein